MQIVYDILWCVIWFVCLFCSFFAVEATIHDKPLNNKGETIMFLLCPILWAIIIVFWFN